MLVFISQVLLRNSIWLGASILWYGWNWIIPSHKDKTNMEMQRRIMDMDRRNSEMAGDLMTIRHMIRDDLNIPEPINMEEYINVVNTMENMTASRICHNGVPESDDIPESDYIPESDDIPESDGIPEKLNYII